MRIAILFCVLAAAVALAVPAQALVRNQLVAYSDGDVALEGYASYDLAGQGLRPGVLIVPDWRGLGEQAKSTARRLSALGCVALAVDMYGKGVLATDSKQAAALAKPFRDDRAKMRRRVAAALNALKNLPNVDPDNIVVMGYCFGGTTALELARSGAKLAGAASFHGGLATPNPADAKNIRCPVIAFHGASDPNVPPAEVAGFEQEMTDAGVDWQLVVFGHAVHSFTNPAAGNKPSTGNAYDEKADRRSWEYLMDFLRETAGLMVR